MKTEFARLAPEQREPEPNFPSARPLTGTANTMAAIQALM